MLFRSATNILPVSVWRVVWCIGMILCAAFFTVSYIRCRIEFRAALPVNNAYVEQWIKERPLKRRISIKQSDKISVPLTYGILHPVILMPKQTDWYICPLYSLVQSFCLGNVHSFQS